MNQLKVVINNRNRLSTTKKLVEDLLNRNTQSIWIIDNESSYPPLLEWYEKMSGEIKVFKYHNMGHWALWSSGLIETINEEWCYYSDSDIELNSNMPSNYQEIMLDLARRHDIDKIGTALSINDIPDHYQLKEQVIQNEKRWWVDEVEPNVFRAHTDTTFCLIKKVDQFESLRIAGNFTCKHIPWYSDLNNLNEEETYYINTLDTSRVTQYSKQHKSIIGTV